MGLLNSAAEDAPPTETDFSQPTVEDVHRWIDAAVHPDDLKHRADYLKKFGVAPSRERIASAERQRRAR